MPLACPFFPHSQLNTLLYSKCYLSDVYEHTYSISNQFVQKSRISLKNRCKFINILLGHLTSNLIYFGTTRFETLYVDNVITNWKISTFSEYFPHNDTLQTLFQCPQDARTRMKTCVFSNNNVGNKYCTISMIQWFKIKLLF